MRSMLSIGGTAGPMLASLLKPYAPPQPPALHNLSSRGRRGSVSQYARMASQPIHLVPQRCLRNLEILQLPFSPLLPEIAAAPPRHHQDALLVGHLKEFFGLKFAFQSQRIQPHVANIAEFVCEPLRSLAQHHVRRPSAP